MSENAPPGGGPGATVIASTQGVQAPTVPNPAVPNAPSVPNQPAPAVPAADALNLAPAPVANAPTPDAPPTRVELDYEDSGLNAAADYFVNTLGLSPDSAELVEAAKGNFAYLESKIAVMGDKAKGAHPFVQLAKDSVKRLTDSAAARHADTVARVNTVVGGETNWKAVQHWARTSLPQDQLKEASAALAAGGFAAEAMARHLLSLATNSPQVSITGQSATTAEATTASLQGYTPLTLAEYREEYKKLVKEEGGIMAAQKSPKLKALNARVIRK